MRICYIAGPFRHRLETQRAAHALTAQHAAVDLLSLGWAPYCPHVNLGHALGLVSEADAADANNAFLDRAQAIYLLPGWEASVGSRREYARARSRSLLVFESLAEVKAWG